MGPGAHPWAEKGTGKEKVRMKEKQTWRRVLSKLEKEKEQSRLGEGEDNEWQ